MWYILSFVCVLFSVSSPAVLVSSLLKQQRVCAMKGSEDIHNPEGEQSMKKVLWPIVGVLLLVSLGCSSDDAKKSEEKTTTAVITTQETAPAVKNQPAEMGKDAVKPTKKKGAIEGC